MTDYTPTTEQVRNAYVRGMRDTFIASAGEHREEFDRWMQAHDAEVRASVQPPTREQVAEALYLDDADHEDWSWATEDNPLTRAAYLKNADAVLALFQQPTPSGDAFIAKGMRVRYRGGGDERIVGDFHDGAWDLVIPGTEKSRMCVEPEVFWETVELAAEPVSSADMAPGATAVDRDLLMADLLRRRDKNGHLVTLDVERAFGAAPRIDPSTIRDVTPPKGDDRG